MSKPSKSPFEDHVARELLKWSNTARQAADNHAYTDAGSLATPTVGGEDKTPGGDTDTQRAPGPVIVPAIVIDLRRRKAPDLVVQVRGELSRAGLLRGTLAVSSAGSVRDVAFACTGFSAEMVLFAVDGEADLEFIKEAAEIAGRIAGANLIAAVNCSDPAPPESIGNLPQLSACWPGWGAKLVKLLSV